VPAISLSEPEKRVALVIGNGAYDTSPLKNPVNDAQDIANTLSSLGFEVIHLENADKRTMVEAMNDFGRKLRAAKVGLFYYAGHGMQVNGINYLIPIKANITAESDVEFESVDANRLLAKMEDAESEINIVILDACRDNPFARSFRSSSRGLAIMDAPKGSFIAFATAPGSTASDGEGRNGLFTSHLLRNMTATDQPIESVMKEVRKGVINDTGNKQIPWQSSSLTGDFFFVPGSGAATSSPAAASPPRPVVRPTAPQTYASLPPKPQSSLDDILPDVEVQQRPQYIKVAIQSYTGHYICALQGGGSYVVANRSRVDDWETFRLVPLGGNRVAIRTYNGKYWCAERGGGSYVVANRANVDDWETFRVIKLGGDKIALQAYNGQYICAEKGGGTGWALFANRARIDDWETFRLIVLKDDY